MATKKKHSRSQPRSRKGKRARPKTKSNKPAISAAVLNDLRNRVAALEAKCEAREGAAGLEAVAEAVEKRRLRFTLQDTPLQAVRLRVDGVRHLMQPGVPFDSPREHAENELVPVLLELLGTKGQGAKVTVTNSHRPDISGVIASGTNAAVSHDIWVDF